MIIGIDPEKAPSVAPQRLQQEAVVLIPLLSTGGARINQKKVLVVALIDQLTMFSALWLML